MPTRLKPPLVVPDVGGGGDAGGGLFYYKLRLRGIGWKALLSEEIGLRVEKEEGALVGRR